MAERKVDLSERYSASKVYERIGKALEMLLPHAEDLRKDDTLKCHSEELHGPKRCCDKAA